MPDCIVYSSLRSVVPCTLAFAGFMTGMLSPPTANASSSQPPIVGFDRGMIFHDDKRDNDYITIRDRQGIIYAMQAGDRPRVEALRSIIESERNSSSVKIMMLALCDAAIARIDGDFSHSSNIILEALHHAGKLGDPDQTINPILLMLRSIHAGNLMLAGQVREWADETELLQDKFYGPLRTYFSNPDLEFRNMEYLKLSVPARSIDQSSVTGPSIDTVDLDPGESEIDNQLQITAKAAIQIDGEAVTANFATSTVIGSIPFSLQRDHHWPVIGRFSGLDDASPDPRTEAVVLIPSIKIGQTILTNQIMTVSRSEDVILGLQQLTRLRHVTMTDRQLRFGIAAPIACNQRPVIASYRSGMSMYLLFPISYGGGDSQAILGIGDNSPEILVINLASFPRGMAQQSKTEYLATTYGKRAHETISRPDTVELGGKTVHSNVKFQLGDPAQLPVISTAALRTFSFSLDLPENMACLH